MQPLVVPGRKNALNGNEAAPYQNKTAALRGAKTVTSRSREG